MKKATAVTTLAFFVLSMCFVFVGCGAKGTKLTFDNYENYLDLNISQDYENRGVPSVYGTISEHAAILFCANAKGVSSNYNYNDVVIKIKVYCIYEEDAAWAQLGDLETKNFETTLTLKLNIAGSGTVVETCPATSDNRCIHRVVSFDYNIIDIQGSVTPA